MSDERAVSGEAAETPASTPDFRALRESGEHSGASKSIGSAIAAARNGVARWLIRVGATPNRITIAGFLFTCGAGYCLARGASQQVPWFAVDDGPVGWWPSLALLFLLLAGACDMLDGAVARLGGRMSRAGAVLDSSVDRFSDIAVFAGCFMHYALSSSPNLTYQVLSLVVLCNALLTSYVKARAENIIENCTVGYWQRGERFAAVVIGCACGHVPAVLWQLSIGCLLTVWRRVSYAYTAVHASEVGRPDPPRGPSAGVLGRLQLWRHPRGSIPYDVVTGANIAYIVFAPWIWPALLGVGVLADPLRDWLGG